MIRMHLVSGNQFDSMEVARAQIQVATMLTVLRIQVRDQKRCLLSSQRVQRLAHIFAFCGEYFQTLDHSQLAIGVLAGQSRTQRAKQFLFGKGEIVAARLRSMYRATVAPEWRADRANTCTASALLLP